MGFPLGDSKKKKKNSQKVKFLKILVKIFFLKNGKFPTKVK